MEDVKFNLNEIEKTFTKYKKNDIFDGVVVSKRQDGVIFNIGGKSDSFIKKEDFDNFDNVKIGDRFKVVVLGTKNDEGMIEVSGAQAREIIIGSKTAESLKIGSNLSFVVTGVKNNGLVSKLGQYQVVVPEGEVDLRVNHLQSYVNKQQTGVVTDIDRDRKVIVVSVRMLKQQEKEVAENNFWNSVFINKIVEGTVKRTLSYGAFVNVAGIDCFIHISDLAYEKVERVEDVIKEGDTKQFRIIKLDKENKKVSLGIKQLKEDPKDTMFKNIQVGQMFNGKVDKILAFGAIIKIECGLSGLLHVSDATENSQRRIYEIVKIDQNVVVELIKKDEEKKRLSFKLIETK